MHDTAMQIGTAVLERYARTPHAVVVEVGSQNVNGSLREACPENAFYLGLDYGHGRGVDLVVEAGKTFPLRSDFADIVVSSSQMEHDPQFWATFLEMCRVTKKGGIVYINIPGNGPFHRYPMDVWRFYPDAGRALERLARANGFALTLLESFCAERQGDLWNDFVAIFANTEWPADRPIDFVSATVRCTNIWKRGATDFENLRHDTEDQVIIGALKAELAAERQTSAAYKQQLDALRAEPGETAPLWGAAPSGETADPSAARDEPGRSP